MHFHSANRRFVCFQDRRCHFCQCPCSLFLRPKIWVSQTIRPKILVPTWNFSSDLKFQGRESKVTPLEGSGIYNGTSKIYIVLGGTPWIHTLRWHILGNIFCSGLFWGYPLDTHTKMAHYGATLRLGGDTVVIKKLLICHLLVANLYAIFWWLPIPLQHQFDTSEFRIVGY